MARSVLRLTTACVAAVWFGTAASPASASSGYQPSEPRFEMTAFEEYVEMDDGVELATTVGFPTSHGAPAQGRFPVLLTMTPYGKDLSSPSEFYVTRGFIHVLADIRGSGASQGTLDDNYFSPREQADGAILIEHFATKPYSNRRVGMIGGSYEGITQYLAAAQAPPHLEAIVPSMALEDLYRDAAYHGGILSQFFGAQYLALQQNGLGLLSGPLEPTDPAKALNAKIGQAQSESIAFDYLANTTYTDFYGDRSPGPVAGRIKAAVLIYDGWFDGFIRGASEMWGHLADRRAETRMWIDPVPHKGTRGLPFNPLGYPADALDSFSEARLEFLDHHLKGKPTPDRPPVKLFVMGRDEYITSRSWPPRDVSYRRFYLGPDGIQRQPVRAGTDSYFANPADGWTNTLSRHGDLAITPYLPLDQSLEDRQGLVWRTPELGSPLTLVGPLSMRLVARSTAPDTDWVVRVSDVAPDGSATLLTEGYLRASHRALDPARSRPERPYHPHTDPTPIEPDEWIVYKIEIWPTANEFLPSHRLRVQLTSNDTPNHTPGAFTVDLDDPSRIEFGPHTPAINSVRYGGRSGSSLLLPVLSQ